MKKETIFPDQFTTDFNVWIQFITGRRFTKKAEVKSNDLWDKNKYVPLSK